MLTHENVCVTNLVGVVTPLDKFERNICDALQYLACYMCGVGAVGLTAIMKDGTVVRLMEDAATLERSRRELWSIVAHGKTVVASDGSRVPMHKQELRKGGTGVEEDAEVDEAGGEVGACLSSFLIFSALMSPFSVFLSDHPRNGAYQEWSRRM